MKKRNLVLALIAFIGIFAISCSNDDNEGETIVPLQGKWLLTHTGVTIDGKETLTDAGANEGCDRDYIDLRVSNTYVKGEFEKIEEKCSESTVEGVYVRSSNNITVTVDGLSKTYDITNLTLSELKLKDELGLITVYKR